MPRVQPPTTREVGDVGLEGAHWWCAGIVVVLDGGVGS